MRCNPWRWLWGLIPIAMLSWITFNWEQSNIEADLTQRTQEELSRQGMDWAVTEFSGRDAVLRGRAAEDGEPKQALEAVRKIWGVRAVDQRTDLMPKADVYLWKAAHNKGRLTLSGHVPSEAARKSMISVAQANFPKTEIEDVTQLARGGPPQDVWLSGANFSLRQLSQLTRGSAELKGTLLSVSGEAADGPSYKSVRAALAKPPVGIKIEKDGVAPATASPFLWSAKRNGDKLVMAGFVPSDSARSEIFDAARVKFDKLAIIDQTEVAGGAPDGWTKAARLVVDQLALLEDAAAEFKDGAIKVSGRATDEPAAEAIRKSLRGLPGTFDLNDAITYPDPVPPAAADVPPAPAETPTPAAETSAPAAGVGVETPAGGVELRWGGDDDAARTKAAEEERNRTWSELESRWAALNAERNQARTAAQDAERRRAEQADADRLKAEDDARRKAEEDEKARRAADEEARRAKWVELELRWGANNEAYARQQAEKQRVAEAATQETRRVEASNCQTLMRDAVKKGRILFNTNSADLSAKSAPTLDALVKISTACPSSRIEISGHTDTDGDRSFNRELSERRAQAIVAYLTRAGLSTDRVTAKGYGSDNPVAPNDTAANKAKNRRIEFKVTPN